MFYTGQRVVCVGGNNSKRSRGFWKEWKRQWKVAVPQRGNIYTVRDTRIASDGAQRIRLCEVRNPIVSFTDAPDQEPWFDARHFRPLCDRKTDISVFTALLDTFKVPENA